MPRKAVVKNAADGEQVRKGKLTEADRTAQSKHNLGVVLSTYEGRQDRWELLASCNLNESVFSTDPLVMANLAGVQNVAHRLLAAIVTDYPKRYLEMQAESMQRSGDDIEPDSTEPTRVDGEA